MTELIWEQMENQGLVFDKHHLPIKVGPDVYMVFASTCDNTGCQRDKYYALTGGDEVRVIKANSIL